MKWVTLAVLASLVSLGADGCRREDLNVLSLCQLANRWSEYHGREVRVRAHYRQVVQFGLYDPECRDGKSLATVSFRDGATGVQNLERVLPKNTEGRAIVVFEGVFYGPEPFKNIDPKLPASVRTALEKSHRTYGHMGAYDYMIEVRRVVHVAELR